MIKSIHMRNCATYGPSEVSLDDCAPINIIYGANGSGKSTISNFLMTQYDPFYKDSYLKWYASSDYEILVYNKKFRKNNFERDMIDGIFSLGEQNVETQKEINEQQKKRDAVFKSLADMDSQVKEKYSQLKKLEKSYNDLLWDKLFKKYENVFSFAFQGFRNNKVKFKDELLKIFNLNYASSTPFEQLQKRASIFFRTNKLKYELIDIQSIIQTLEQLKEIEENNIWDEIIVGNNDIPISYIINKLKNLEWVSKGRQYIGDDGICPFCQQHTISDDFKEQLIRFFDDNYTNNIQLLNNLIVKYRTNSTSLLSSIEYLIKSPPLLEVSQLDISSLNSYYCDLSKLFQDNVRKFESKISQPNIKIIITNTQTRLSEFLQSIKNANQNIQLFNQQIDDESKQTELLIRDIWSYLCHECKSDIQMYIREETNIKKSIKGLQNNINLKQKELATIDLNISLLHKKIISIRPAVEEINRILDNYGFKNFKISSTQDTNKYQIQRENGELATFTLSEGEETFLTFLYFLQLAKGSKEQTITGKPKILIIDDPISSLDSTILYIVSILIREIFSDIEGKSNNIAQVFILTHNIYFHKEISQIDGRTTKRNSRKYWIIQKHNEESYITSYGIENPIKTTYELLWAELRNNKISSIISLQNTMRRIIEYYFNVLGSPKEQYNFIESCFHTYEEKMICKSLFAWMNDGSHSISDDINFDINMDSAEKYKKVFKSIFINSNHQAHYDMMMKE